jgi:hypothetical protein
VNEGMQQEIMDILQRTYGGITQSFLNRLASAEIIRYFRERIHWMSPGEVAVLVQAAGGKIVVNEKDVTDDMPYLVRTVSPVDGSYEFTARRRGYGSNG